MARALMSTAPLAPAVPELRRIGVADLRDALSRGLDDFLAAPTQLFFLGLLYPVIGFVAARAAWGGPLLPLLYPLLAGLSLMGPVMAIGLYEISRRREQGHAVSWLDAFAVLRSPAILSIAALGLMLLGIFLFWLVAAQVIYGSTVGAAPHATLGALLHDVLDTPAGLRMLLLGNAVGGALAVLVLVLTVVSFPMILDRGVTPGLAIRTSIRAVALNPGAMALWGMVVVAGLVVGTLPLFIGLAVVVPVLGHATWHLYRKVVVA
ncbi:DUF2189 domain-containing protein [Roseomonas rosulenta]|uniref:DUF2189 domain-containing protein n=1 Tax=Roseomonas rosulenta TaxID=2748667 RepID=UPI0018DF1DFB|nr:DUF2189 domain-containing protein [Roseomonas rosulenta]